MGIKLSSLKKKLPGQLYAALERDGIVQLRPCQEKALKAGLLEGKNLLVCTPTASGKTLIAELAAMSAIVGGRGKAVYVVPLRALASEKYADFKRRYGELCRIALSIGDLDGADPYLEGYDLIVTTSEKLDSLIRHRAHWLRQISVLIIDEIHLLNDASRGPALEMIITLLRQRLPKLQLVALSATIGNPETLAAWLEAGLVLDDWRPVELRKGIYLDGRLNFYS